MPFGESEKLKNLELFVTRSENNRRYEIYPFDTISHERVWTFVCHKEPHKVLCCFSHTGQHTFDIKYLPHFVKLTSVKKTTQNV